MAPSLTDDARERLRRRISDPLRKLDARCEEWFDEQATFWAADDLLAAALCGRRAGKTRGGCLAMLREAVRIPGFRGLYVNETRAEAVKLAWHGGRGDGMYSLVVGLGLPFIANATELSLRFVRDPAKPELDSWIYLIGADDEAGVQKALGVPYHLVWWDEAQKIPPKLAATITSTLMPSLLDFGGRLRFTGTPVRVMAGLFYEITRDRSKLKQWRVHRWNLMANPFFGRAIATDDGWVVLDKRGVQVAGPFATPEEAAELVALERHRGGILALQTLLGGPDVCPLDSPMIRREGYGEWVHEDALYIYDVHKVKPGSLFYAPHRTRSLILRVPRMEGERAIVGEVAILSFPDIARAMADLPGYAAGRPYFFAVGADIGYSPDPFAFVMWAWSLVDPALYEVAAYRATNHDAPEQAAILRHAQEVAGVGIIAADAGGSAKPTVKGWSEEWLRMYGIPLDEVDKHNKGTIQATMNGEIVRGLIKLREGSTNEAIGSPLYDELATTQYLALKVSTGRLIADPTIADDTADGGLYGFRISYAHRFRATAPPPAPGTPEYAAAIERTILERAYGNPDDLELAEHHGAGYPDLN